MNHPRGFKQRLAAVSRRWDEEDYDGAFAEVEALLEVWSGNAHLHILRASLLQLREDPEFDLDEVKETLQRAVELDRDSPAASIELGHFRDTVRDDPQAASKPFAEGVATARRLLLEGLIGQAKVYRQLDKRDEFLRCLLEILHLTRFESGAKKPRAGEPGTDLIVELLSGSFRSIQLDGPHADQIQELLAEVGTAFAN